MLAQFKVKNFKNFKTEITVDLESIKNYEFNTDCIRNGLVNKALIYGPNGSGKSNLGLAVFDIVLHLSDKEKTIAKYIPYLNLESGMDYAEFYYKFRFDDHDVEYKYQKRNYDDLKSEEMFIDGKQILSYDYDKGSGGVLLQGTENLNKTLPDSKLSFVKYVSKNSVLAENTENEVFMQFIQFIDGMLLFYSLSDRMYQGFTLGSESISKGIIESGHLKDFEKFLSESDIEMHLIEKEIDGEKNIYVKYPHGEASFFKVASTGTSTLALFYYWYIKMEQTCFVFIDEFDAFYHFELSEKVINSLKVLTNTQIILTTHNTDLMNNDLMRPDCYFEIENGECNSLANRTNKELRKAHNLQKMYKAGAFSGKR